MEWHIDPVHTSLEFAVKHMGVFTVRGTFEQVSGVAHVSEDGTLEDVRVEIDATTVSTRNAQRDEHLRSEEFFDAENHPRIIFQSTEIRPLGGGEYEVAGELSMRGQTHPVTFRAETTEPLKDPFGGTRAGANLSGAISRKQWGLTWNQALETGALVVSDEVKFTVDVQAVASVPAVT
jgi:polyisoprenoid-binding protein YceI